jgi:diamine N-acetyltransferase
MTLITTITIHKAAPEDVLLLQQIGQQTFLETFSEHNTEADMQKYLSESFSIEHLTAQLTNPDSAFYFAWAGEQVVGYLKLNFGAAQTEKQDENAVEIERIYVLHAFHGQKVGQLLYDKALEVTRQRQAPYLWLGVWEENKRAIRFYEKNGFTVFGTHIFKLGDDEQTDFLMRLAVTGENV